MRPDIFKKKIADTISSIKIDGLTYNKVWSEEFNQGTSFNSSVWSQNAWANIDSATVQVSNNPALCTVQNGIMTMKMTDNGNGTANTQMPLSTINSMSFMYGYAEMRAKLPVSKDCWPAWWVRSKDAINADDSVLFDIEIDMAEFENDILNGNMHRFYRSQNGRVLDLNGNDITDAVKTNSAWTNEVWSAEQSYIRTQWNGRPNISGSYNLADYDYHTYGFLWTPQSITLSIDGNVYATIDLTSSFDGYNDTDAYHQPVYFILSNQLKAFDGDVTNKDLSVDYIRLYQTQSISSSQLNTK